MSSTGPIAAATAPELAGTVVLALATVATLLLTTPRLRAAASIVAIATAPLTLLATVTGDADVSLPDLSVALVSVAVASGIAVLAVAAVLCLRFPRAVMPAALVALPLRVPIAVDGDSVKLLVPLYLVIGGAVVAEAWQAWRGEAGPSSAPRVLDLLLAAFLGLYAVQSLYSPDPTVAAQNFAFFYAPFSLLYAVATRRRWDAALLRTCVAALVVLALLMVAAGFVEFARGEYLLRPGGIKPNDFDPYFRVQSLFFDPNMFGRFLMIVMLIVAAVMIHARRVANVFGAAAVLAVLWAGLVLTLSQSSFAALFAGLLALAALRWDARRTLTATAVLAVVGITFALALPSVSGVDLRDSRSAEKTTSGRFDLVKGGVLLWRDRPLLGQGSGGFAAAFERRSLAEDSAFGSPATTKSHTAPLTVAAEQGFVGFVVFLALIWAAFKSVYRRVSDDGRPEAVAKVAVASAFTALFVHSLAYAALFEDPFTWMLLGVGVALAARPRTARRVDGADSEASIVESGA